MYMYMYSLLPIPFWLFPIGYSLLYIYTPLGCILLGQVRSALLDCSLDRLRNVQGCQSKTSDRGQGKEQ